MPGCDNGGSQFCQTLNRFLRGYPVGRERSRLHQACQVRIRSNSLIVSSFNFGSGSTRSDQLESPGKGSRRLGQALGFILTQKALEQTPVPLLVVQDSDHHVVGHRIHRFGFRNDARVEFDS